MGAVRRKHPCIIGALMATAVLIGVDLGTHSAKGCVFDRGGRCLDVAEVPYRYDVPHRGWAEIDAEAWWRATCEILRRFAAAAGPSAVAAIGVTGQAPTLLAVDADGHPVR